MWWWVLTRLTVLVISEYRIYRYSVVMLYSWSEYAVTCQLWKSIWWGKLRAPTIPSLPPVPLPIHAHSRGQPAADLPLPTCPPVHSSVCPLASWTARPGAAVPAGRVQGGHTQWLPARLGGWRVSVSCRSQLVWWDWAQGSGTFFHAACESIKKNQDNWNLKKLYFILETEKYR